MMRARKTAHIEHVSYRLFGGFSFEQCKLRRCTPCAHHGCRGLRRLPGASQSNRHVPRPARHHGRLRHRCLHGAVDHVNISPGQRHHGAGFSLFDRPFHHPSAVLRRNGGVCRGNGALRSCPDVFPADLRTRAASGRIRRAASVGIGGSHARVSRGEARNRHGHGRHRDVGRSRDRARRGRGHHRRVRVARMPGLHRAVGPCFACLCRVLAR